MPRKPVRKGDRARPVLGRCAAQPQDLPNVIDIRNFGLIGAIELSAREGKPGARAYDVFTKCFHEKNC